MTVTVTATPTPQPTTTVTVTPTPQPTPTATAEPQPTVTVTAQPQPTVTVTVTPQPIATYGTAPGQGSGAVRGTGNVVGCTSTGCSTYYVPSGYQLGCSSTSCQTYFVMSGYQLGCSSSGCNTYFVMSGYQLGCSSSGCDTYFVMSGYQLGCTATSCDTYYVMSGYQLGCSSTSCDTYYVGYSTGGNTKDVDLQLANVQQSQMNDRAQALTSQYSMSLDAAKQLTVLADRMQTLSQKAGGLSDQDRTSLADAALGVAGVSHDAVVKAYAQALQGDKSAVNSLMVQAATNIGMKDSSQLRDQILPSLGIYVP